MKPTTRYRDLLSRTPPRAEKPMALSARAAQFAPFAALVGHDAAIAETARLTDRRLILEEDAARELSATLQWLTAHSGKRPAVTVMYFVPDEHKAGGAYVTYSGVLRRVDETARQLHFVDRTVIAIDDIYAVSCENDFTSPVKNDMMEQRGDGHDTDK